MTKDRLLDQRCRISRPPILLTNERELADSRCHGGPWKCLANFTVLTCAVSPHGVLVWYCTCCTFPTCPLSLVVVGFRVRNGKEPSLGKTHWGRKQCLFQDGASSTLAGVLIRRSVEESTSVGLPSPTCRHKVGSLTASVLWVDGFVQVVLLVAGTVNLERAVVWLRSAENAGVYCVGRGGETPPSAAVISTLHACRSCF